VTARVVDDLELIEVQIADRVTGVRRLRRVDRLLQAILELAAIEQARQRHRGWPRMTAAASVREPP
jgi:transcription termination factor NusB